MKRRIPIQLKAPRSKYGVDHSAEGKAKRTVDGITFDSLKEARRYSELKLLERAGNIKDLLLQPRFALEVYGETICAYVGDFQYFDVEKEKMIIEDVKSKATRTRIYLIKEKMLRAQYGLTITEI